MSAPSSRSPSPTKSNDPPNRSQSGGIGSGNSKEPRPRDPRRRTGGPKQPTQDEMWKYWVQLADINKRLEAKQSVPGYRPVDDESNDLFNIPLLEALLGLSEPKGGPFRGQKSGRPKRLPKVSSPRSKRAGRPASSPDSGEIRFVIYISDSDNDSPGEDSSETSLSPPNLGETRDIFDLIRSGSKQNERARRPQKRRVADLAAESSEGGKRGSGRIARTKSRGSSQMTWRLLEQTMRQNQTMLVDTMRRQAEENWQQEANFTHEMSQLVKDTQQEMMRALRGENGEPQQRAKRHADVDPLSTPPSSPSKME